MAYSTGTASNHDDLLDRLRTFLTTAGPGGAGWTELQYEGGNPKRMLFMAPGLSGTEEIFVGFRKYEDLPGDTYGFYGWMARAYDPLLDMQSQPGDSGNRFHPTWDTSIPYWFMGNGQRVIIVTKIATTYWASYLGKILQYGTPSEYGTPFYLGMPFTGPVRYSTISENVRNFFDPSGGLLCLPNGGWYSVSNFYESSGEAARSDLIWCHPYTDENVTTRNRWRELRENPDGTYQLFPITLYGDTPNYDSYGELDGAYAISGFSAASEDTVTAGGVSHLLVQNGFRTARYYFAAIAQE